MPINHFLWSFDDHRKVSPLNITISGQLVDEKKTCIKLGVLMNASR